MAKSVYSLKCGAVIIFFITFTSILNFYIGVDLYSKGRSKWGMYIVPPLYLYNGEVHGEGGVMQNFRAVEGRFAILVNALVDPVRGHGKMGGEVIHDVQNQKESEEYFTLDRGYFSVECQSKISHDFIKRKRHLNNWMEVLTCRNETISHNCDIWNSSWTIAFNRTDYANLYVTMIDFYNTFLLMKSFHINVTDWTILWIDGHPMGALDNTWTSLFGRVIRAGALTRPTLFKNLIWAPTDYPLPSIKPHFYEQFRDFVLERHNLSTEYKRNCSRLKITFLWRRDYLAHPRKMSGFVERKIKNEEEILNATKSTFPSHHVTGVQLDLLNMTSQLRQVSTTDVFVGMHGAGLTHTMFLPKTSALLELFPYMHSRQSNMHVIAQTGGLVYDNWVNLVKKNNLENGYTYVKVRDIVDKIKGLLMKLCH